MKESNNISIKGKEIAIIGPFPPPTGGMAVQTELLSKKIADDGAIVYRISSNPWIGYLNNIRYIRGLLKFIIFSLQCFVYIPRANIIHIMSNSYLNFYLFTIPPLLLGKFLKRRTIINFHGGAAEDFLKGHSPIVLPFFQFADSVLVQTAFLANVFKLYGIKTYIIPNVVPLDRFKFKRRDILTPKLISTRNLESNYNIACAIRAFKIVHDKIPEAQFTIIGDGTEKDQLIALTEELEIADAVHFKGSVINEELPQYYDINDIFINTSNVDNMPVSILEAFASGLLVVTTNPGGIPYMVKNGENGFLVNTGDFEALAERVITLLSSGSTYSNIVENAYNHVRQISWENIRNQLLHIYFDM